MKTLIRFFAATGLALGCMLPSLQADAQTATKTADNTSLWFNGPFIVLFLSILILLSVIAVLGKIVKTLVEQDTFEFLRNRKSTKVGALLIGLMLSSVSNFAQEAVTAPVVATSIINGMDNTLFWTMLSILMIEFIVIMILLKVLVSYLQKKGLIQPIAVNLPKWLQWKTMVGDDLPIEKEADLLTDHDYDGIQELDNGMPPMLKYIFVASIAAAVIYWGYYEMGSGPTQLEEYQNELVKADADKMAYLKLAGNLVDENTVKLVDDAVILADGQKIYATNCVACHGDKGQGGVGPNLTDANWIHGGSINDIFKTIKYGVPDKGMRAWQSEIKPADMQAISSYIIKEFGGKNVAGGKAPQGAVYNAAVTNANTNDTTAIAAMPTDSAKTK
ncbi:MAG: c-type cytochrome [Bacteroidetes bacterium]|nr:c-type cytochrome [Bacteroidota bacterium]